MQQDYKRQPVKLPNVYHNDYVKTRIRAREFENYLKLFEPSSNFEMYKDMRRSIKPSLYDNFFSKEPILHDQNFTRSFLGHIICTQDMK